MPCPALEGSLLVLLHVAHFWPWRKRSRHSGDWMGLVGGGGDSNLKVCFSYFLFRACSRYYSGVEQSNSKDMICSVVDVMEKYSAKFYTFFFSWLSLRVHLLLVQHHQWCPLFLTDHLHVTLVTCYTIALPE